ncbi:hypothetical protein JW887_03495 [Candidatus Dojkabacteria bacterium]|nr:hypothetical protein [Candidatus Dojkabacteria bacterium]
MKNFLIERPKFDSINGLEDLPKVNKSDCGDMLSQIMFYKIDGCAYTTAISMHNAIHDRREVLPFLILCTVDEITSPNSKSQNETMDAFNNATRLFTAPNEEFKQVVTRRTFPMKAVSGSYEITLHFNPYMLSVTISILYFLLSHDVRIEQWCKEGKMKNDSIDDILKIVEDKYSSRFVDLANISEYTLNKIFGNNPSLDGNEKIRLYESLIGTSGTNLVHQYVRWITEFYERDLLTTIQSLFGRLQYS